MAANKLHFWSHLVSKRMLRAYLAMGGLLAVFGALLDWGVHGISAVILSMTGAIALGYAALACILVFEYATLGARARRTLRQHKALQGGVELEWSQTGIRIASKLGAYDFDWTDFVTVKAGRDVVLLYQTETLFNLVPMRALQDGLASDLLHCAKARRLQGT